MAQRIFIACRSNHDPLTVARLAYEKELGRGYDPKEDFVRWAGAFDQPESARKCHVLVDCNAIRNPVATEIPLSCYSGNSDKGNLILLSLTPPPDIPKRLRKDYAWGQRGPAPDA